ncbi:MAG: ABC transporter permease [Treponema sp.]|jgi:putative ABC transport system permease protein|nr:ABC transporter permease [Treponema sp.]
MIEGILIEGLVYGVMVLGVFITFRVLSFADMTVDGSFPMGSAVMVVTLLKGFPAPASLLFAFAAGGAAGLVTSLIHTRLKVPDLLSGILTMTMLYSVNLRIMSNRANISLLRFDTFFTRITAWSGPSLGGLWGVVIFCALFTLAVKAALDLFFHTDYGLSMGALGANPQLVISQGMNPDIIKISGICLANGLAASAGALTSLYQGFADVSLGTGIIVSGLASLMLGELIIKSNRIVMQTLRVLIGSVLYRGLMYLARDYGYHIRMTPNDFKLITGLLIIFCIVASNNRLFAPKRRRVKPDRNSGPGKTGESPAPYTSGSPGLSKKDPGSPKGDSA